jgi:hypothetical protein
MVAVFAMMSVKKTKVMTIQAQCVISGGRKKLLWTDIGNPGVGFELLTNC